MTGFNLKQVWQAAIGTLVVQRVGSHFLKVAAPMLLLAVAFYTLAMNFRTEFEERLRFQRKERAAALRRELEASQARLETLSRQDALTGVPNRRRFDEVAWQCWQRHHQTGEQLAVMLLDVDHFKKFNDTHGHDVGDQVLKMVAAKMAAVSGGGLAFRSRRLNHRRRRATAKRTYRRRRR